MIRVYNETSDYQHIRVYGTLMGYTDSFIKDQQKLAYMLNAPWDTVEIIEGKAMQFQHLPGDLRKKFGEVK